MVEIGERHPHDPKPENLRLSVSDNDETRRDTEEVAHSGDADGLPPGQQTIDEHPLPSGEWEKLLDSSEKRWGGSGSAIPEKLDPREEISLSLNPGAFVLLSKASGGG